MHLPSVLLFAAVLIAHNAAGASTTTQLISSGISPEALQTGIGTRFLRTHPIAEAEPEDRDDAQVKTESEERGIDLKLVDDAVSKIKDAAQNKYAMKVDDLLEPHYLNAAESDKGIQDILFRRWAAAPTEVRKAAISKLTATEDDWTVLLKAWKEYKATKLTAEAVLVPKKADEVLPKSMMLKANDGNHDAQAELFRMWIVAPPRVRQEAIAKVRADVTYSTLLTAWRFSGARDKAGLDMLGYSIPTLDDLLQKSLLAKAISGDVKNQNVLFSRWAAAHQETRDAALKILRDVGKGTDEYSALNNAWQKYLKILGKTLDD
uniref:RxLR effector protein n=1 Tax=Phytophthora parvispora TaxID=540036 RepID=A0A3G3MD75_9STRA|nr:Avh214 protein [Phytophthora parvispora]